MDDLVRRTYSVYQKAGWEPWEVDEGSWGFAWTRLSLAIEDVQREVFNSLPWIEGLVHWLSRRLEGK